MSKRTRSKAGLSTCQTPDEYFRGNADPLTRGDMRMEINSQFIIFEREGLDLTDPKVKREIPWRVACKLRDEKVGGWGGLDFYHMKAEGNLMIKTMQDMVRYQIRNRTTPYTPGRHSECYGSQSSSGLEKPGSDEKVH